ncbi:diguanylate cyclase (GGDEF)-like protein [Catenuloplanes nepalensis]|uniref:Diguanylate cyclase (GGDEF)-like protein n=1 Tax=Catenuloplanes nepalensis TaxID=587533 RepID=A0ABT9MNE1_9ACTN|nr:diguanylate cyclase (GGDEF)-like protein [Catenuloplanes nepalensis]
MRTRVVRVRSAGGTRSVICKRPLGPGAADRLRRELSVLRRLDGVVGTPRLAPGAADDGALVFVDMPARTLDTFPVPWEVVPLLDLACGLAEALAAVHRRGVVHRDVCPANILLPVVDGAPAPGGQPTLIDFELSTTPAEERFAAVQEQELAGTLPYLAPEQTGRTGRPVDHRADLYALGATLYEVATGEPPFGRGGDPLRLVHDHLARVPVAPAEVNPRIPALLSAIIMRLLGKEPEQRYQSGEGLTYDLGRLREAHRSGGTAAVVLGERDFAMRLAPPARLIGRDGALAELRALFTAAVDGTCGVALVTGAPGVGKTALIEHLRPDVTAAGGRFVTGKFDQYRRDLGADAVLQAFCALGAQLLSEPDEEVARLRSLLLEALGADAALAAAALPPFATLLGVAPEQTVDEPRRAAARMRHVGRALLRVVAGSAHPVVIFVDDLQWAGPAAFRFLDGMLDGPDLPGVLVLGAFREAEVDAAHPLTAVRARVHRVTGGGSGELRLDNLAPAELGALLAETLRLPVIEAAPLAEALAARTGGNPFDTLELVNALRREGALVPDGCRWRWDPATLRRFVSSGDVVDLLAARIEALPARTRRLLEVMACLGGDIDLRLLRVACGEPAAVVDTALLPGVEDGLIVVHRAGAAVASFRHDRVQQAAHARQDPHERARLHLALARRLAAEPDHALVAAEQYLPAVDALPGEPFEPGERHTVASLLRAAATAARLISNYSTAEKLLAAAVRTAGPADPSYRDLQTDWHAALCSLGRFAEADEVYQMLAADGPDPVRHAEAACAQIVGLTNRSRPAEALALGLDLLDRLGVAVARGDALGPGIDTGLDAMYDWLRHGDAEDDLRRPELADPRLVAVARVISRLIPPSFYADPVTMAWLVVRAGQVWAVHGPAAALVGVLSCASFVTVPMRGDYRTGYEVERRVIAVGEARGYEPDTAQAKCQHAIGSITWFAPLEVGVRLARDARDGLLRGGDLQNAANTYYATVPQMLDCAAGLDEDAAEVDAALALCERIGYGHAAATFQSYRWFIQAMRGESDDAFDLATLAGNPLAAANFHLTRGLAAAIYADGADLARHVAALMPLLPSVNVAFHYAVPHVLAALSAAARVRDAGGEERAAALAELDRSRDFLAARAADQPGNYRHLHRLTEAERAWATGDVHAAATAFDAALSDVCGAGRPWHAALIAERAGLFFLAYPMEHAGQRLLADACRGYAGWGALGKVRAMHRRHPFLASALTEPIPGARALGTSQSVNVSTETIDLMAVLEAARALSSETSLDRLRMRVQEVLSAVTGATTVRVILWDDRSGGWTLPADAGHGTLSLSEAADRGLLPLAALRYAERTREPMLIDDASRDDRVARDPYLAGAPHCSLLVVPVLSHGVPRAMLLLENRLTRRAFSMGRLDAVLLIAGQLTVSIDNALVYASLERKVAERTEELAEANLRLELQAITDPLTGLPNRRRLSDVLESEWLRGRRSGRPLGLAMIDVDNFKRYNDHYGHHGGDECLRLVARTIAGAVRTTDLVARYGGEEFCVVMPDTGADDARLVAERVRRAVADLREPHAGSEPAIVTISVGLTAAVPAAGQPDELVKIADQALYKAKHDGRNRVAAG